MLKQLGESHALKPLFELRGNSIGDEAIRNRRVRDLENLFNVGILNLLLQYSMKS